MTREEEFLLIGSRKVLEHCQRLANFPIAETERSRLRRIVADEMKFIENTGADFQHRSDLAA